MAAANLIKRTFAPAALVGQIYAREYGSTAAPLPVGNVLALELSHEEDVQKQPDMTQLGGGTHAEMRRVTEVNISMTLADLNVVNLARASLGTATGVDSGTASAETFTVTRGGLLRTKHIGLSAVTVTKAGNATVTDEEHLALNKGDVVTLANISPTSVVVRHGTSSATATVLPAVNYTVTATGLQIGASAPDFTDGLGVWVSYVHPAGAPVTVLPTTNYEVRPAGLFVFPDATGLADGDQVSVTYSYADYAIIEALTTKAKELELTFEGLNEADDGKLAIVEIWRASQGVAANIALLQDSGFLNLEVSGAVLKDDTKQGAGISKYYRVLKT